MNKKTWTSIISLTILSTICCNFSYWADDSPTMVSKINYPLYEYNVTNFCWEFKNSQNNSEFVYLTDSSNIYKNLDTESSTSKDFIWEAQELYKKNMDWIYGCATSIINLKALEKVKKELWAYNNELLSTKVQPRIEKKIQQVKDEISSSTNKCKVTSTNNEVLIKKAVLDQGVYEYCRYMFYLQYLKEYTDSRYWMIQASSSWSNVVNDFFVGSNEFLAKEAIQRWNRVAKEINDTEKAFPIAFKAYSEYENNLVAHILLELLRDDYLVLREQLHKTLNPINQVVYKLSNATRK